MRKYEFDEYCKKNSFDFSLKRAKISSAGKFLKRKPRVEKEWDIFFVLMKKRWESWMKDGKFKQHGLRRYEIKL